MFGGLGDVNRLYSQSCYVALEVDFGLLISALVFKGIFALFVFILMAASYFMRESSPSSAPTTASPAPVAVREISPLTPVQNAISEAQEFATPLDQIMDAEVASMRQLLPLRTDDYMSIVDVKYGKQTLLFIQKRNEWMGPRRFTLELRYSHDNWVKSVCGNPYLVRFLKRGVAIQYNYLNYDGSRLGEEVFYPEECGS